MNADPGQPFYYQMLSNLKLIKQMAEPMIEQLETILKDAPTDLLPSFQPKPTHLTNNTSILKPSAANTTTPTSQRNRTHISSISQVPENLSEPRSTGHVMRSGNNNNNRNMQTPPSEIPTMDQTMSLSNTKGEIEIFEVKEEEVEPDNHAPQVSSFPTDFQPGSNYQIKGPYDFDNVKEFSEENRPNYNLRASGQNSQAWSEASSAVNRNQSSPTEGQLYLQEGYYWVDIDSEEFSDDQPKIKEYAIRSKREDILHVFGFVAKRKTSFLRIWMLINKVEDEVVFLINQSYPIHRSYLQKCFDSAPVEFYLLNKGCYTPSRKNEFLFPFEKIILYSFFQMGKPAGSNFFQDLKDLEKVLSTLGVGISLKLYETISGELERNNSKQGSESH